jgi:hypothetical protein
MVVRRHFALFALTVVLGHLPSRIWQAATSA